jgi:hypothetical protein
MATITARLDGDSRLQCARLAAGFSLGFGCNFDQRKKRGSS